MKSKSIMLLLAVAVLLIGSAFAQVEVTGAYQFSRIYQNGAVVNAAPGWSGSLYVPFLGGLGVVGEATGTSVNSARVNTYGAGLEYKLKSQKLFKTFQPYVLSTVVDVRYSVNGVIANVPGVQSGAGIANVPGVQSGAGVDWKLSKHFALRTGGEYLYASSLNAVPSPNSIRPIAGITYRF